MGATNFDLTIKGKSMASAYREAVTEAEYEYGHNAYNGTISTTNGFTDKTSTFKASGLTIDKFIEEHLDNTEKWGSAWGVEVKKGEFVFFGWAAC
jgi:hypothetical protein